MLPVPLPLASGLEVELDPVAVLEVAVPVEQVDDEEGRGEDHARDLVDARHRVKRLLGVGHVPRDAALAPAVLAVLENSYWW